MRVLVVCALLVAGCGRVGFGAIDDAAGVEDDAPVSGPRAVAETGAIADAPGRPTQTHLVYAENAATWWLFYLDDTTTLLRAAASPDLATWTTAPPLLLTEPLLNGRNLSVAYQNLGGTDVIHVALAYLDGKAQHAHVRGQLSPTSIAWSNEETVGCIGAFTPGQQGPVDGPAVVIGHDDVVYDFTSAWNDDNTCSGGVYVGNFDVTFFKDGSGWTTPNYLLFVPTSITAHWGAPTGNGALTVQAGGQDLEMTTNFLWSVRTGTTWSTPADVLSASLAPAISVNDWSAVRVTDTNHLLVARAGEDRYVAMRFDGMAWFKLSATIPPQPSVAASGPFLASDGSRVWLFVIDGDAIKFTTYDGTSWSAWAALDVPPATRSSLSGSSVVSNTTIGLVWSEAVGTSHQLMVMGVPATR